MQLSSITAPAAAAALPPTPVLATPAPSVAATTAAVTEPVPPAQVPEAAPVSTPVADASSAQSFLGRIGAAQNKYVQSQMLVGAVTQLLGARLSMIGDRLKATWHELRGE